MFERIGALAVYVTDLERAKKFYTEILGFRIRVELGPELCFLVSESGLIHIYLEGGCRTRITGERDVRLGFFLESARPAGEIYEELREAGVELLDDAPRRVGDDIQTFRLRDPDGNIIEVSAKS